MQFKKFPVSRFFYNYLQQFATTPANGLLRPKIGQEVTITYSYWRNGERKKGVRSGRVVEIVDANIPNKDIYSVKVRSWFVTHWHAIDHDTNQLSFKNFGNFIDKKRHKQWIKDFFQPVQ